MSGASATAGSHHHEARRDIRGDGAHRDPPCETHGAPAECRFSCDRLGKGIWRVSQFDDQTETRPEFDITVLSTHIRSVVGHCVAGAGLFYSGSTTSPCPSILPAELRRNFSCTMIQSSLSVLPKTCRPIGDTTRSASCRPAILSPLARRLRPRTRCSMCFA